MFHDACFSYAFCCEWIYGFYWLSNITLLLIKPIHYRCFNIMLWASSDVTYKDGVLDWILDLVDTPLTIINYNYSRYRYFAHSLPAVHYTRTEPSRSAIPYQSSGTSFQRRTFLCWVHELSPFHSHCDSHCALRLELTPPTFWSFIQ
jgi:hypothetical protein